MDMQAEVSKAHRRRCYENPCGPISSFPFHLWLHTPVQHPAWLGVLWRHQGGWTSWTCLPGHSVTQGTPSFFSLYSEGPELDTSWLLQLLPWDQPRYNLSYLLCLWTEVNSVLALCLCSSACSWSLFRPSGQQIWREGGEWVADAVFASWVEPQSYCSGSGPGRRNTCLVTHPDSYSSTMGPPGSEWMLPSSAPSSKRCKVFTEAAYV